ncbi:MAG: cytochrome P450 [Pseudonocardiaceae bacterium]
MDATVQRVTTPAGDPAWLVTGYDTIKWLLGDPRLGRSHADPERASRYSESVIFGQPVASSPTEQADHTRIRRLLAPSFSARRMQILRRRVDELVDGLLDDMDRTVPPVDFHEKISFPLPALVICELLGVPYEDREDFRRWSDDAGDMTDQARSRSGLGALWQYMHQLAERKRARLAEDVLSDLVAAQERDPEAFTADHVAQLAAGLLFAGHETTVAAIDKGLVLLLTNPGQRDALQQDPTLLPGAVEEILRLPLSVCQPETGEATGLPRWANADIDIDGTTIRTGDLVLLDLLDANLDRHRFPAPEVYDLARASNPHLTFGHGPHFCIGAPLARIELQALFGALFHRFPGLQLAVPVEELRPRSQMLTGGLTTLPVTW